jgi:tyrosinase
MARPSRREFLKTGTVAAGAAIFPFGEAPRAAAPYTRWNISSPQGAAALVTFRKAIRAMLALPPEDPRNWYRHTLVHTLDCPHGNWWFLPWHRGYIGWFEQTCRELTGDAGFAIPYWDWTAPLPSGRHGIPDALFDDVLVPTDAAFIGAYADFEAVYKDLIANAGYWNAATPFNPVSQYGELLTRGVRFNDDLWFDIARDPRGRYFYERAHARGLTREQPYFDDETAAAVSLDNLHAALSPDDFISFASAKAPNHSANRGFAPLEAGPHNLVHNNVGGVSTVTGPDGKPVTKNTGGFMQDLMSPVDPIFFLHHSNIDRIWDVWTRKQQARGLPILPDGTDYTQWAAEPFLFFLDAKGQPVGKRTAGDYASIGDFGYAYEPGSGEDIVAVPAGAAMFRRAAQQSIFQGTRARGGFTFVIPPALLAPARSHDSAVLIAKITAEMPAHGHASRLRLFVNPPGDGDPGTLSPHFAGSFTMFRHHAAGQFTFTLPLATALAKLRAANLLNPGAPIVLRVMQHDGHAEIVSIVIEAH